MKLTLSTQPSTQPPVSFEEAEWPAIAEMDDWDAKTRENSLHVWTAKVREHADGRRLVHGAFTSRIAAEHAIHAGYFSNKEETPFFMQEVVREIGCSPSFLQAWMVQLFA